MTTGAYFNDIGLLNYIKRKLKAEWIYRKASGI